MTSATEAIRDDATTPGRGAGWSGRRLLVALIAALVAATLLAITTAACWPGPGGVGEQVTIVAEAYLAVVLVLVVAAGWGGGRSSVRDRLALHAPSLRQVATAFGGLLAAAGVSALIYLPMALSTGDPDGFLTGLVRAGGDADRLPHASTLVLVVILLRVLFLSGVAEELLFRGALHGWVAARLRPVATIVLIAVLFTVEHAARPVLIPFVLAYGLALGVTRHRSGSVLPGMATHMVVDLSFFVAGAALVAT